ncbi:unnamed protein product, partial [Pylaiella littoralis]
VFFWLLLSSCLWVPGALGPPQGFLLCAPPLRPRGKHRPIFFDEELYALSVVAAIFVSPCVGSTSLLERPNIRRACAVFFFVQPPTRRPNAKCCCICIFWLLLVSCLWVPGALGPPQGFLLCAPPFARGEA